jgi:superfamily II DNA or RNA helicase
MAIKKLSSSPLSVGAAGVYPYSEGLHSLGYRKTFFGDDYNMFNVIGHGDNKRILVPRNMAGVGGVDKRVSGMPYKFTSKFIPRDEEQSRVIKASFDLIKAGKNFLINCPTGFGKTFVGTELITKIEKKTLILVTKEDLRDQWIAAAKAITELEVGKGIGLIQGDTCLVSGQGIVIAMVQSLAKLGKYPSATFSDFGAVIVDEVHLIGADFFSQSLLRVPAKIRIGLSATTERKDGKSEVIEAHIGVTRVKSEQMPTIPYVIARESPWKIPMTKIKNPMTGKSEVGPIPHKPGKCGHIFRIMSRDESRNNALIEFIIKAYNKDRTILVASETIEHIKYLRMCCIRAGISAHDTIFYIGGISKEEREKAKTKSLIFATYKYVDTGTDLPALDTLVMGTPRSDITQVVGRILRFVKGKKQPVVFDLIDSSSGVFKGYWRKRKAWYQEKGAQINIGQ